MALASKKQNLELFYNMFLTEYETSLRNIEMCKETAEHVYESVQRQWDTSADKHRCLVNYDKALTDLSQLSDKLRKLNIQFELDALSKSKEPIEEIFSYPPSVKYEIGYESECIISYIKDEKNKLFYIAENGIESFSECIDSMKTYFQKNPRVFKAMPQDGEVFGLYLEGYMFRAVKENGNLDKFSNFRAFLIDVGEIVTINESMEMYVLPANYQKLPAQAVLCKLEQVNSNTDCNLSEYLSKSLYVKHKFKITDKDSTLLYVKLFTDTNPFRNKLMQDSDTESLKDENSFREICNPFKSMSSNEQSAYENARGSNRMDSNEIGNDLNNGFCDDYNFTNDREDFIDRSANFNVNYEFNKVESVKKNFEMMNIRQNGENYSNFNGNSGGNGSGSGRFAELTEDERRILYEEPLQTTNAMKAIMGYDPKDDKRICQYYNPKTDSCFKGAKCQLEHVEKISGGWTRDEALTVTDIRNQIVYPRIGETITLIPTHIINAERFFGQIVRSQARYEPSLKELIYKMNSPESVISYRQFKTMPVQFELVIAMFSDGHWYRAKILNVIDDDTVKVFYVDYGNSKIVSIDDIRIWERRFEYLPFQGIRCNIAGLIEKRKCAVEAAEQLRKTILNIPSRAVVVDNVEELVVQIFDIYENDVAEGLVRQELAETKIRPVFNTKQYVPS